MFQDVDIVWFRDPITLFNPSERSELPVDIHSNDDTRNSFFNIDSPSSIRKRAPPDAYLSDDGQRSLRYTPFYANSGFYYLFSNNRTIYFTWSIMKSFDLLHITGSHQNIFTIRLMEGLDL